MGPGDYRGLRKRREIGIGAGEENSIRERNVTRTIRGRFDRHDSSVRRKYEHVNFFLARQSRDYLERPVIELESQL
jgi:hypothetical protein